MTLSHPSSTPNQRSPIFAQCLEPLTRTCALAASHPRGLVLLHRDEEDEASFLNQALSRVLAEHEQGESPGSSNT